MLSIFRKPEDSKTSISQKKDTDLDALVPPVELMFDGTNNAEEFKEIGDGFTRHFLIGHAKLLPNEKVLDIGCGIGQKARALVKYLDAEGSYEGIDIVPKGIQWCQEKYVKYPNFNFTLANIYNKYYNENGIHKACDYNLPYTNEVFDLAFFSSVFTHMLPRDMENYIKETARVLRKGGRCISTFFLLNSESLRYADNGNGVIKIPYRYDEDGYRIADEDFPEKTVAHYEQRVRDLFEKNGFCVTEISYGFWCGRKEFIGALQDAIIAVKR